MRNRRVKSPWLLIGHAEDKDLPWEVSLPDLEVLECRSARNRIVGCPINSSSVHPDAQIGFNVVRGNSPVLRQFFGKTIAPMLSTG